MTEGTDMQHWCYDKQYVNGRVACVCQREQDHTEAEFDIPVGEE